LLTADVVYAAGHKSGGSSPLLQFPHKNFYNVGQMGGMSANGVNSSVDSWGIYRVASDVCSSGLALSDNFGLYFICAASGLGTNSYIDSPTPRHESGSLIINIVRFATESNITSIRFFTGLTDQTGIIMTNGDNPAGEYIGLQYSTDRGDINWQFVRKDGTTQVLTNTGVAPIASRNYLLRISTNGSTYKIELMDQTIANVVATSTYISGGPAATTDLRFSISIESRVAAVRQFYFYYTYGVTGVAAFY